MALNKFSADFRLITCTRSNLRKTLDFPKLNAYIAMDERTMDKKVSAVTDTIVGTSENIISCIYIVSYKQRSHDHGNRNVSVIIETLMMKIN